LKIIYDFKEAKTNLLKRLPLEQEELPQGIQQRIKDIFAEDLTPSQVVERIISEVRSKGDDALFDFAARFEGGEPDKLEVKRGEITSACSKISPELYSALNLAANRIRAFHLYHKSQSWIDFSEGGMGQWIRPLEKVGIYVPGGTASYPSTLLMGAIPAKVAGVKEIIVVTPSNKGEIPPATLAAASIAQVDRVFGVGGAQAIAALAFGTKSIPRVDKICGPGNIFVQLAKKTVYGTVDIDGIYGPTETVVLADDSADPAICAADLLSQAEHDPLASAIMITTSSEIATRVKEEVEYQLTMLERKEVAAASLERKGGIVVVADIVQAIELINDFAPEHLLVMMRDTWSCMEKLKNAGGIFIGENSPEVIGDYIAGPSHIMPTGGAARFGSPITVDSFLKTTSIVAMNSEVFQKIAPAAVTIARAEGLGGHARAVEIRSIKAREEELF